MPLGDEDGERGGGDGSEVEHGKTWDGDVPLIFVFLSLSKSILIDNKLIFPNSAFPVMVTINWSPCIYLDDCLHLLLPALCWGREWETGYVEGSNTGQGQSIAPLVLNHSVLSIQALASRYVQLACDWWQSPKLCSAFFYRWQCGNLAGCFHSCAPC